MPSNCHVFIIINVAFFPGSYGGLRFAKQKQIRKITRSLTVATKSRIIGVWTKCTVTAANSTFVEKLISKSFIQFKAYIIFAKISVHFKAGPKFNINTLAINADWRTPVQFIRSFIFENQMLIYIRLERLNSNSRSFNFVRVAARQYNIIIMFKFYSKSVQSFACSVCQYMVSELEYQNSNIVVR